MSEHGQHLQIYQMTRSTVQRTRRGSHQAASPRLMSPDSDDALSPENASSHKRNNSSLKKLYHNFDTFALNCKVNGGEKEFKIDRIIKAMPNPKPQWEKPKLQNITYKNCYFPSTQNTY